MRARNEGLNQLIAELLPVLPDPAQLSIEPAVLERLSHDFYWYSPILRPQLAGRVADIVIQPTRPGQIQQILRIAYSHTLPVTVRGAGTANCGQSVPLDGGILLDLSRMDEIEEITGEGLAICQAGVRLADVEEEARARGWELRCYPSTFTKATVGGFLAGGSGGVGAIAHGGIRDFDNVEAVEILTMEEQPQFARLVGMSAKQVLHAWGTNGIITRAWLKLAPALDWQELACCFPSFEQACRFGETLATSGSWNKRLVALFEWPIPTFYSPIQQHTRPDEALALVIVARDEATALGEFVHESGGSITLSRPAAGPMAPSRLSDFTWNHSTLWAMKADPAWTYLQLVFQPGTILPMVELLRGRYGHGILFHFEFMRNRDGVIVPFAIPLVRFESSEQIAGMIEFCRAEGIFVANPHVYTLEDSGRLRLDNLQMLGKMHYDHRGLLNPGKMRTFRPMQ